MRLRRDKSDQMNSLRFFFVCVAFALSFSAGADTPPNNGTYTFTDIGSVIKLTLTKAKNGNFTIGGTVNGHPVSGTLFKSTLNVKAVLHGKNPSDTLAVDGSWDKKRGTLLVTIGKTNFGLHNLSQPEKPEPARPDDTESQKNQSVVGTW